MGMNDNAGLYTQKLCYNKAIGPYQCLSLPWWVRTSKHATYPPRHGCELKPLICGEEVFRGIHNDLLEARATVDIVSWGFDPGMTLVRSGSAEDAVRYGDLLKQIATNKEHPVTVRLLLWHDNAATYAVQKNNPGYYGARIPTIGAFAGFFSTEHDLYNRAWFDDILAGKFPNIVLHTREVALKFRDAALADEHYKISPVVGWAASIYPAHHQKMVLIDYVKPQSAVGYVMGHNSTTDFWDTVEHRFQDPQREKLFKKNPVDAESQLDKVIDEGWDVYNKQVMMGHGRTTISRSDARRAEFYSKHAFTAVPYQDVALRVRGPILFDLNHNFCQGWTESAQADATLGSALWMTPPLLALRAPLALVMAIVRKPETVLPLVPARRHLTAADFMLSGCQHSAQLLRTYPAHQEKSIKECYANLTRLTQHYIFIQNQYVQYEEWATYLTACVEKLRSAGFTKPIYVFIVTSTPELDGMDLATYDIARELGRSDTMLVEHADTVALAQRGKGKMPITVEQLEKRGVKALMASMWTGAKQPRSRNDYEETYIHTKVAIVDDAAFTVGSANLNVRSMALDSELNVLSQAMDVALDLRQRLFKQCTNDGGPAQFGDMKDTFGNWESLMKNNSEAMQKGFPLTGQVARFHVDRQPGAPVI